MCERVAAIMQGVVTAVVDVWAGAGWGWGYTRKSHQMLCMAKRSRGGKFRVEPRMTIEDPLTHYLPYRNLSVLLALCLPRNQLYNKLFAQ